MKAVVAAFNQEKALVGAFSVITNLRMELFGALVSTISGLITPVINTDQDVVQSWHLQSISEPDRGPVQWGTAEEIQSWKHEMQPRLDGLNG